MSRPGEEAEKIFVNVHCNIGSANGADTESQCQCCYSQEAGVSVVIVRRQEAGVMCRVSQSFYTFNTALLSCSYLVHSILAVILISGVLVLEVGTTRL